MRPTMASIAQAVAAEHRISVALLRTNGGNRTYKDARHQAMWLMYATGRYSNAQIGGFMGGRHHTTVIYGRKAHEARLRAAQELAVAA